MTCSSRRRRTRRSVAASAAAVLLVLAGCSSSADEPTPTASPPSGVTVEKDGTQVIELQDSDTYRFAPSDPHVNTGKIRIDMTNTSKTLTHSLAFKPGGPTEEIPFLNPGAEKSIGFVIQTPGEYRFFCTFHEQLGQRGVLTVEQQ